MWCRRGCVRGGLLSAQLDTLLPITRVWGRCLGWGLLAPGSSLHPPTPLSAPIYSVLCLWFIPCLFVCLFLYSLFCLFAYLYHLSIYHSMYHLSFFLSICFITVFIHSIIHFLVYKFVCLLIDLSIHRQLICLFFYLLVYPSMCWFISLFNWLYICLYINMNYLICLYSKQ